MPKSFHSPIVSALAALAITACATLSANAASYTWSNAAGGSWSTASNWSPAGVPNAGDAVTLPSLGGAYAVTLDAVASLSGLSVGSGVTLSMSTGDSLEFTGSGIQNDGLIVIGPAASNALHITHANDNNPLEITGSGAIELHGAGHILSGLDMPTTHFRVSNGAGHTIRGSGDVWVTVENFGTLEQDGTLGGLLTFDQHVLNHGTIRATDGGHINVRYSINSIGGTIVGRNGYVTLHAVDRPDFYSYGSIDNLQGGSFIADGGNLDIDAGVVAGGTIYQTNGSGVVGFHNTGNPNNLIVTAGAEMLLDGGTGFHIDTDSFQNHGTVHIKGTLWLGGSQSDTVATSSDGVIDLQNATIMGGRNMAGNPQTLLNAGTITGCGTIDGTFINSGTINIDCPTLEETIASPRFTNRGRITVSRGYLHLKGTAPQVRNIGVIDGANGGIRIDQGATLQNTGGVLVAGRSNVAMGGQATPATIVGGTLGSGNGGYFVNSGPSTLSDVTLAAGSTFYTANRGVTTLAGASLVSRGTLAVQQGGTLTAGPSTNLIQREGVLLLQGGVLDLPTGVRVQGVLQGTGRVIGKLVNAGEVIPDVAGITVQGDYVQEKAGRLTMGVGGYTPDLFSHLTVTGAAALDGRASLLATGGFVPQAGHAFNVLSFGSSAGRFAVTDGSPGLQIEALYDAASVQLQTSAPAGVGGASAPTALRFAARGMGFALELPEASEVTVAAYDVTGRQVAVLASGVLPAGVHGYSMNNRGLASGMYFARATLKSGGRTQVRDARVIVLR